MDNLNREGSSHFETSTTCGQFFIDILDGEIVSGGDYTDHAEPHHDMRNNHSNWYAVKRALEAFISLYDIDSSSDGIYSFVEICQALNRNSQGFHVVEEICKENLNIKKLEASLDTLNQLLI